MRVYLVINNDEHEPIAVTYDEMSAEMLIGQLEEEDIRQTGCEYEYQIYSVPLFENIAPVISGEIID